MDAPNSPNRPAGTAGKTPGPEAITRSAGAKVNLYLHVGPIRADGYHEIASLFAFCTIADRITVAPADTLSLKITGPFAPALAPFAVDENLIMRAAQALRQTVDCKAGAAITLEKNLPVAAGIGGGSADAAAALLALIDLWTIRLGKEALTALAFDLGADVPACLNTQPVMVSGAGEIIEPAPTLPDMAVCLVNPRVETPTGPIFHAFDEANPAPAKPDHLAADAFENRERFFEGLGHCRNDLEAPAGSFVPAIAECLKSLGASSGVRLARMSGSGATVLGLFDRLRDAEHAANAARTRGWWAQAGMLMGGE